jgi:hypothetical protein
LDDLDEETIEAMPLENKKQLLAQFLALYNQDAALRQALSGAKPDSLSLFQKY